ncbi:MAG: AraC family transcriptional regulator [Phycisphaerae bacterium]
MAAHRRIALLIESSRAYGRRVLQGITQYSRCHGQWSLYYEQRQTAEAPPKWLRNWRGDGIIARVDDAALARAIRRTGLPAVDLRGNVFSSMPVIKNDSAAVAELCANHLLERGFYHLAYCGFAGLSYSEQRLEYFRLYLAKRGLSCHVHLSASPEASAGQRAIESVGLRPDPKLIQWIGRLPKPVGIMACNDVRGQQVLNTCRELDIAVPEQIAVVGVDNDDVLCDLSYPPMSSVELDTQRVGCEAAALLDRLMAGEPTQHSPLLIRPVRVIVRQSTDILAIDDPHVAEAVRHIRLHAIDGIKVEGVLDHLAAKDKLISRRTLERRFANLLGRTLNEEIMRVRLDRVKSLLLETDWPLCKIAQRSGFEFAEYMSVAFKRELQITPGEFRRQHQLSKPSPLN